MTQYGDLELPPELRRYGAADGMSLDTAIEILVKQNLDLEAARLEIPMADADVLTANLRANPVFYATPSSFHTANSHSSGLAVRLKAISTSTIL